MGIAQCLALSLADFKKDELMLPAANYFWSNTFNSFLFNHGPMTPTLLDIKMLTGSDITTSINPFALNIRCTHQLKTKNIGGSSGYINEHMGTGPISDREHIAFPTMWLERSILCGSTCGPTSNFQHFAQALVEKKKIPFGQICARFNIPNDAFSCQRYFDRLNNQLWRSLVANSDMAQCTHYHI